MKSLKATATAAALAASLALPAFAGFSIGGFYGVMDTEMLGEGAYYGAQIEAGVEPISFILRGAIAEDFDDDYYEEIGYLKHGRKESDHHHRLEYDDPYIVPIEAGILLRLPEGTIPLFSIYGGAGVGYYLIPELEISAHHHRIDRTDSVDDLFGFWACAGIELDLAPLHIFAEAKYVDACDDVDVGWDGYHVKQEIDLTGWTALIGARIGW